MSQRAHASLRRQRGIATVELALIAPVLIFMLVLPLFLGRIMWHYTIAQKAAHDAARYLASASAMDMRNTARAGAVATMAKSIAYAELAELDAGHHALDVTVLCSGSDCTGSPALSTVTVIVKLQMDDIFFPRAAGSLGYTSPFLQVNVTFPFVGI